MEIEMNGQAPQDAEVIDQPTMKYQIVVAPNINGGLLKCMWYALEEKGVSFGVTPSTTEQTGFIPNGSFGAILPI